MSSGSLSSSPLTFQYALGVELVDVFKVFSLCSIPPRLWSRSQTSQLFLEGFQGFHPGQSSAASSEQLVDFPVPHGGPHLQDPGLASLPHEVAGAAFQGVFSTFPRRKKSAKIGPHSGSELLPESSPSTWAAHSDQFLEDESGGTWMLLPSGRWYLVCSDPEVFWDGPG